MREAHFHCCSPLEYAGAMKSLSGVFAQAIALLYLIRWNDYPVLVLFTTVFLFLCCVTDTFLGEIPNPLNLALIVIAMAYHIGTGGAAGLLTAIGGMLLGCALLFIPYLLGGMGGGDVKALAALGALLGPADIFQVFLYTGLIGGVLALACYLEQRRPGTPLSHRLRLYLGTGDWHVLIGDQRAWKTRYPYAAAFVFGYFAFFTWGGLL